MSNLNTPSEDPTLKLPNTIVDTAYLAIKQCTEPLDGKDIVELIRRGDGNAAAVITILEETFGEDFTRILTTVVIQVEAAVTEKATMPTLEGRAPSVMFAHAKAPLERFISQHRQQITALLKAPQ